MLQDPSSLAETLAMQPNVLEYLSTDELGSAIGKKASGLSGADFSNMLKAVSGINPETAVELIQAVRDAGSLGDFLNKYTEEGLDFLEDLTGLDVSVATSLVKAFAGGLSFLRV